MSAPAQVRPLTPTGVLVTAAEPGSEEWFAARRGGITGTDLPKILGDSGYGNALSVWLDKRGEAPEDTLGEAGQWGHLLEDVVAREWARRSGAQVTPVGVLAHADQPWMCASLDRLVTPGTCPDGDGSCGLEVKTRSAFVAGRWSEDVPDDVLAQVAWGLAVTGLHHMHVAVLLGGQRLESFRVDRDAALERYLVEAGERVWTHVEAGIPPVVDPDADGVLLGLLNQLHADRAGQVDLDPGDAGRWLVQYQQGAELARDGEALKAQAKTALVQLLGDGEAGLLDGVPAFTYRRPAAGVSLPAAQVKRLAKEDPDTYAALREAGYLTTTNPGPRFALAATREA